METRQTARPVPSLLKLYGFFFSFFPSLDKKSRCKTANYRVQLHTANTENAVSVTSYLHEALGGL